MTIEEYILIQAELDRQNGRRYSYGQIMAMYESGKLQYKVTKRTRKGVPLRVKVTRG